MQSLKRSFCFKHRPLPILPTFFPLRLRICITICRNPQAEVFSALVVAVIRVAGGMWATGACQAPPAEQGVEGMAAFSLPCIPRLVPVCPAFPFVDVIRRDCIPYLRRALPVCDLSVLRLLLLLRLLLPPPPLSNPWIAFLQLVCYNVYDEYIKGSVLFILPVQR